MSPPALLSLENASAAINRTAIPIELLLSRADVDNSGLLCRTSSRAAPLLPQWPATVDVDEGTARTSQWRDIRSPPKPLSFADVGFGLMIAPTWSFLRASGLKSPHDPPANAHSSLLPSLRKSCDRKWEPELLACALSTWGEAVGGESEVLLLVDCVHYCEGSAFAPRAGGATTPPPLPRGCAMRPRNHSFAAHTRFPFPTPAWLANTTGAASGGRVPAVTLRCYWGKFYTDEGDKAVATNVEKGAALHAALYEVLPPKRFYVKLDLDTALWPPRLLALLSHLSTRLHPPEAPVHFGSTTLAHANGHTTITWPFDVHPTRRAILQELDGVAHLPTKRRLFKERAAAANLGRLVTGRFTPREVAMKRQGLLNASQLAALRRKHATVRVTAAVRETREWRMLEKRYQLPAERTRVFRVSFAQGAIFGHSRASLGRLVASKCMQHMATLDFDVEVRRTTLLRCEDAAVGLCMHLLQVPFVDTPCIVGGTLGQLHTARQVLAMFRAECRTPVAVHPVKTRVDYLGQWHAFREDEKRARALAARGQTCGAEAAPKPARLRSRRGGGGAAMKGKARASVR